ncbi:hypothetical protein C8Q74DRAFT_1317406 [Fomes fomentarius]|nr:hypothetical protein C8Q74DRAFT_1317406 [Fomes fomentarius]
MGFFSARRAEDQQTIIQDDPSVLRVIRSRFYGKAKGKERELEPTPSHSPYTSSSLAASTTSFAAKTADKRSIAGSIRGARKSTSTTRNWPGSSAPAPSNRNGNASDMTSRTSTDLITVTLAQRLNELATANSEGLLSDDEYRLLRQNLFERFASSSAVPTESPLVPMTRPAQVATDSRNTVPKRRSASNFHVQPTSVRSPSVTSKKSFSSTVSGLIRRATSRRVVSMPAEPHADTMSIYSMMSSPPERVTLPRKLSKQSSDMSLRTSTSTTRASQPSNRRTPFCRSPSSFHGSSRGADTTYTHIQMNDIPDDDQVESVQDIRHQIELVEAEGRRLLDAFNGLELSTLTKRQRKPPVIPPIPSLGSLNDGNWPSGTLRPTKDTDALSFKSSGSARTARSLKRSPSIGTKMRNVTSASSLSTQQSVIRKGSMSSVSSRGRTGPSLPTALPTLVGHLGLASSSSVNLARSTGHLPLETVEETEGRSHKHAATRSGSSRRDSRWAESSTGSATSPITPLTARSDVGSTGSGKQSGAGHIDDEELMNIETELTDIRRRRAEVTARYERAELREKILRK